MEKLSSQQAFEAMVLFLEMYYEHTQSDDVGGLLSDMIFLEDGTTADPATWGEWVECIERVLNKKENVK